MVVDPAAPTEFPLELRIPAWAQDATVTVDGRLEQPDHLRSGAFHRIERRWKKGDRVELRFPLAVRVSKWYQDSVAVERGPLVFALRIGENWQKLDRGMSHPAPSPATDWEVRPTTPWNYGLLIDTGQPGKSVRVVERPMGAFPFSTEGTPVELMVKGRRIPDWKLVDGSAGPLPASPVVSADRLETLTLIPYGAAKLRVTAFPRLAK